jgi:deoxyadenosine/deoxycytidine kinase
LKRIIPRGRAIKMSMMIGALKSKAVTEDDVTLDGRKAAVPRYFGPAGHIWLWCPPRYKLGDYTPRPTVCSFECCDLSVAVHEKGLVKSNGQPFTFEIMGNIGAGKSSLSLFMKEDTYPFASFMDEGVEEWRNIRTGAEGDSNQTPENLLDSFYKEPKEFAYMFQSQVMLTKARQHREPIPAGTCRFLERSLDSARHIFAEALFGTGMLTKLQLSLLDGQYQYFRAEESAKIDAYIWLDTPPKVCFERIKARGRPEEKDLSLEYLTRIHALHALFFDRKTNGIPVVKLNGNQARKDVAVQFLTSMIALDKRFNHWLSVNPIVADRLYPRSATTGCRCPKRDLSCLTALMNSTTL